MYEFFVLVLGLIHGKMEGYGLYTVFKFVRLVVRCISEGCSICLGIVVFAVRTIVDTCFSKHFWDIPGVAIATVGDTINFFQNLFKRVAFPVVNRLLVPLVSSTLQFLWVATTVVAECAWVLGKLILGPPLWFLFRRFQQADLFYSYTITSSAFAIAVEVCKVGLSFWAALPFETNPVHRLGFCATVVLVLAFVSHRARDRVRVLRPCYLVPILLLGAFGGLKFDEWVENDQFVPIVGGGIVLWVILMIVVRKFRLSWVQNSMEMQQSLENIRAQMRSEGAQESCESNAPAEEEPVHRRRQRRYQVISSTHNPGAGDGALDGVDLHDQGDCSICLEPLLVEEDERTSNVCILGCKHMYHTKCINEWRERQRTCPLCRGRIVNIQGFLIAALT